MIKWGILGLGNMAHKFAETIQEVEKLLENEKINYIVNIYKKICLNL